VQISQGERKKELGENMLTNERHHHDIEKRSNKALAVSKAEASEPSDLNLDDWTILRGTLTIKEEVVEVVLWLEEGVSHTQQEMEEICC